MIMVDPVKLTDDQLKLVQKEMNYCNIPEWHSHGWKGQNTVVWIAENDDADHGDGVERTGLFVGPMATVIVASIQGSVTMGYSVDYNGRLYSVDEFIVEHHVKIVTRSIAGPADIGTADSKYWLAIRKKYNIIINNSGGNNGAKGAETAFPADAAMLWAAAGISDSGQFIRKSYSAIDWKILFIMFTGYLEGTSFSSPWGAFMEALIVSRYGHQMTHDEMVGYLTLISKNIVFAGEDPVTGKDPQSGFGLPILPKYSKRFVSFTVGSPAYYSDGILKTMDTTPVNVNGTVFVPLRAAAEALGCKVEWDETTDTATITDTNNTLTFVDDIVIELTLGSKNALVEDDNDGKFEVFGLTAAPYRDAQGRTMVPMRFISERLDCKVGWVQSEQKVLIVEK